MAVSKDVVLAAAILVGRQEACARASRADGHRGSELWRPLCARWFGGGSRLEKCRPLYPQTARYGGTAIELR